MSQADPRMTCFQAQLFRPAETSSDASWTFVVLPKEASDKVPRRGRTTVDGTINGRNFRATLDPDGQLSHWLQVSQELREAAGAVVGDVVTLQIMPVEEEPEPELPPDFLAALCGNAKARAVWDSTTALARLDWIHWITSAKQAKTRGQRIVGACDMLASGKKRVCCFDPSGYYSKAFSAPLAAERKP